MLEQKQLVFVVLGLPFCFVVLLCIRTPTFLESGSFVVLVVSILRSVVSKLFHICSKSSLIRSIGIAKLAVDASGCCSSFVLLWLS